jgi:hypothetical protein
MPPAFHTTASKLRVVFALLLLALVCLPAVASAAPQFEGVATQSLWPDANSTKDLDLLQQAGASAVRVDVGWPDLEYGGKGQYSQWYIDKLDAFTNAAQARGIKVIMMLWATPCWASSQPASFTGDCNGADWYAKNGPAYPPANNQDYADVVRFVTQRWGSKLAALELWNEPQQPMFWRAADPAKAYVDLVKAAYPAAKAGDASVPVIAGGMSSYHPAFLQQLYDDGIKGSYDGLNVHPYADDDWSKLRAMRQQQLQNGDSKPMWLTEFGWPTGTDPQWHVSEAVQAASITAAFAGLSQLDYVKAAMVYSLRDGGTNLSDQQDNFGLVDRNYTPKLGYTALSVALHATTSSTNGSSSTTTTSSTSSTSTTSTPKPRKRRVVLRFVRAKGAAYLKIDAPQRAKMTVSVNTCGTRAAKVLRVSMGRRTSITHRVGSVRALAGCRLTAKASNVTGV